MTCRKVDSQLHRITSVLGQALSSSLTYIKSNPEETTYDFSGYISTVGHYSRLYQYIFLNNRPIRFESLQGAITQLFQQSSFAKDSLHYEQDGRRSRERHPVFVLTLKCPVSEYDICADPSKVTAEFEVRIGIVKSYKFRATRLASKLTCPSIGRPLGRRTSLACRTGHSHCIPRTTASSVEISCGDVEEPDHYPEAQVENEEHAGRVRSIRPFSPRQVISPV